MLPATVAHLEAAGYARPDATIDRKAIGKDVAAQFDPVLTADEIGTKGRTIAELTQAQFGGRHPDRLVNEELEELMRSLTAASSNGYTQIALGDGHVLCTARVARTYQAEDGSALERSMPVRYVTANPDLIERDFWIVQRERAVRDARELAKRVELAADRVPALEARKAPMLTGAVKAVRGELEPSPTP